MPDKYEVHLFNDARSLLVISGALFAGAIVFLGSNTLAWGFRVAIILLLMGAVIAAFAALQERWRAHRVAPEFWSAQSRLNLGGLLLALAFLAATIGYIMSAWRLPKAPVEVAAVTYTVVEASAPPSGAPPPPERGGTTQLLSDASAGSSLWWIFAGVCAGGSVIFFALGKRVAGTALATASIAATGWKLFNIDKAIEKLNLNFKIERPAPRAPTVTQPSFDMIWYARVGHFDAGDALLTQNAKRDLADGESTAWKKGHVGLAIAVGHVDYRTPKPSVVRRYGSNQGLALQRAVAIQQQMRTVTVIPIVGGPMRTQQPVAESALAADRAVDVYFFGTRNPP